MQFRDADFDAAGQDIRARFAARISADTLPGKGSIFEELLGILYAHRCLRGGHDGVGPLCANLRWCLRQEDTLSQFEEKEKRGALRIIRNYQYIRILKGLFCAKRLLDEKQNHVLLSKSQKRDDAE